MIWKSYKEIKRTTTLIEGVRANKFSSKKNTKYGIILTNLTNVYKSLLKDRLFSRYIADDDRALNIVFHCLDIENDHRSYNKIFYLNHLDKITTINKIKYFNNVIKWTCSICEKTIYLDISRTIKHQNLVCEDCLSSSIRVIDSCVIENYTKLSKYILNKIESDHTYLLKKIRRNRKRKFIKRKKTL